MKVDFSTDIGAVRESNQDSCECGLFSKDSAWAIVCDGMGGANGGNVASSVAVSKMKEVIENGFNENMTSENIRFLMLNAVAQANDEVFEMSQEEEHLRGMGTTVVLMIATKGLLHVAHAGDSRAYLRNKDGISQITTDHSYVQELVNLGEITRDEARVHPKRNMITRVLGVRAELNCDYTAVDFSPGDMAIACSDGLSNYVDEALLLEYMDKYGKDGKNLANQLIQFAVKSGGSDNVTVAVVNNG